MLWVVVPSEYESVMRPVGMSQVPTGLAQDWLSSCTSPKKWTVSP